MKSIFRNIILGAAVLAWSGLTCVAGEGETGDAKPKREAPKPEKMECEIVSVDAAARTVEVKSNGQTTKLTLSDKAKIKKDGKEATLADLKAGEKCTCTVYSRKDGSKSVARIVVGEDDKSEKKKKE